MIILAIVLLICCFLLGAIFPYVLVFSPAIIIFIVGIKFNWNSDFTGLLTVSFLIIESFIFFKLLKKKNVVPYRSKETEELFFKKDKKTK
ncbi:membrane protein implicated in regulation of membrane protease activity [Clostridium acetobutylicum]|uniref:Predicted membrane protein n=1 Tax=Clostridium acetobutylicum (strain ATCC 824 / DSM 792 / JCM 1419 / IAM 19013 / LMG 5710 / NBRC 13948 / NRRL B-527 / VKM B-1787 / 2291 / W) TaxID=272562 RepID=Q97K00_CLOAB|nr:MULTISPECIES: hypothetical protein [Clostridium]AAK79095.1 Predicted membrane protein [Clostridium acetobutylicum ATCC 824]ADZ20171.1 membrane protein [Clostridium acetobutylicum EA 2018]AEI31632.1 hypothetical protein SMB_G1140 [Clostridium acetobutylicum DSM 1731]AWV81651.1 hypothetical protein DK921_16445 [Clostridium acetobutylicum]MBC2393297.1 hypothetical protein [Clostridium acetobutylicum]